MCFRGLEAFVEIGETSKAYGERREEQDESTNRCKRATLSDI